MTWPPCQTWRATPTMYLLGRSDPVRATLTRNWVVLLDTSTQCTWFCNCRGGQDNTLSCWLLLGEIQQSIHTRRLTVLCWEIMRARYNEGKRTKAPSAKRNMTPTAKTTCSGKQRFSAFLFTTGKRAQWIQPNTSRGYCPSVSKLRFKSTVPLQARTNMKRSTSSSQGEVGARDQNQPIHNHVTHTNE